MGLSLTLSIKNILYIFSLDSAYNITDIQLVSQIPPFHGNIFQHPSNSSSLIIPTLDTVKLLCECAQLQAPHGLRHAIFVITSSMSSFVHLKEHIQLIRKKCLVNYSPDDISKKREVTLTLPNGITANLRIHECYPYVCISSFVFLTLLGSEWCSY